MNASSLEKLKELRAVKKAELNETISELVDHVLSSDLDAGDPLFADIADFLSEHGINVQRF